MQSFIMHIEELGTGEKYFVKSWRYVNEELRIILLILRKAPGLQEVY